MRGLAGVGERSTCGGLGELSNPIVSDDVLERAQKRRAEVLHPERVEQLHQLENARATLDAIIASVVSELGPESAGDPVADLIAQGETEPFHAEGLAMAWQGAAMRPPRLPNRDA